MKYIICYTSREATFEIYLLRFYEITYDFVRFATQARKGWEKQTGAGLVEGRRPGVLK